MMTLGEIGMVRELKRAGIVLPVEIHAVVLMNSWPRLWDDRESDSIAFMKSGEWSWS